MSMTSSNVTSESWWSRNLLRWFPGSMESLSSTKGHLAILSLYLDQAEARDKICRTIQYGSKFVSGGNEGVAHHVDLSTGLARKVFRLLKSVDELKSLVAVPAKEQPSTLVFLGKSKNTLMATYLLLDNLVWAGRIGIYKNKKHTEVVSNVSLYFFLGGCACSSISELLQLAGYGKKDKAVSQQEKREDEKQQQYGHALSFVKSSMDVIVAVGLLQLASKRVTPRVTGAFGTITSLITCYELFKKTSKHKTS